jgi:hypothetical protein
MEHTDWIGLVVGLVGLMYVVAPLLIFLSFRQDEALELGMIAEHELPQNAMEGIGALVSALAPHGFETVHHMKTLKNAVPSVQSGQIIMVNRSQSCFVTGVYCVPAMGKATWSFWFRTMFEDGSELATGYNSTPSVFPDKPKVDGINVRWISDPEQVYLIHAARVEQTKHAHRRRILPFDESAAEFLQKDWREELERVREAGYVRHRPASRTYRPTIKGACIMTWRLLFPLKQIRNLRRDRKAKAVLQEIGYHEGMRGSPAVGVSR